MERLDRLSSYFLEKDRKKIASQLEATGGLPEMTEEEIRISCLENDGYDTPELNDKLYLHFRGFRTLQNLDKYVNVKALFLESNGLEKIENLEPLQELRCLYLGKNLIPEITGLSSLKHLTILDLSNNRLTRISGLSECLSLQTLNVSRNALSTVESIEHLKDCHALQTLDVTNNSLDGDVLSVLREIPGLLSLSINGNPCTQQPAFRKIVIAQVKQLGYLDRPVDALERACATAYVSGGKDAEAEVRNEWKERERNKKANEMQEFRRWQNEQRELRQKMLAEGNGQSLITEFTPEELAQRKREAEEADRLEKQMVEIGIGRIGQKYWQMHGANSVDRDELKEAMDAILAEDKAKLEAQHAAEAEAQEAENKRIEEEEASTTHHLIEADIRVEEEVFMPPVPPKEESATSTSIELPEEGVQTVDKDDEEEDAEEEVNVEVEEEEESQDVRDQRVAESLAIYFKQLENKENLPKSNQSSTSLTSSPAVTWETTSSSTHNYHPHALLYWTEWMDYQLANLVRSCVFDFALVASRLKEAMHGAEGFLLSSSGRKLSEREKEGLIDLVTVDTVQNRWTQLDAQQWGGGGGEDQQDHATNPVVYKICISSEHLGNGHGAQPTYQSMASLSSAAIPKYLKVPTTFPAMADYAEDDALNTLD